jgi:hypothetical protein
MKNTKWSKKEVKHIMEQWKVSGLDKKAFCSSQGISYGRFLYWTKRLAEEKNEPLASPALVRLEVITEQSPNTISISGPNGITLHMDMGAHSISFIKALLTA